MTRIASRFTIAATPPRGGPWAAFPEAIRETGYASATKSLGNSREGGQWRTRRIGKPKACLFPTVPGVCSALLLLILSPVLAEEPPEKASVPNANAQAEAAKLIHEVYGDECAAAKTAAAKQSLAKKLLQKASEADKDQAGRFGLLRLSRDIATEALDGATAFEAIDEMDQSFQIDALEMKLAVMAKGASRGAHDGTTLCRGNRGRRLVRGGGR